MTFSHEQWTERVAQAYRDSVARGEHDRECEYHPEGFYLCHCKKRRRVAVFGNEPPSAELYFPPPSCTRCDGDLYWDEGWRCDECSLRWSSHGTDAEYTDDHGDDLAAESARWAACHLTHVSSDLS